MSVPQAPTLSIASPPVFPGRLRREWDLFIQGEPAKTRPRQGEAHRLCTSPLGRGAPGGEPAITAGSGKRLKWNQSWKMPLANWQRKP